MNRQHNRIIRIGLFLFGLLAAAVAEQSLFKTEADLENPKKIIKQKVGEHIHTAGRLIGSELYGTNGKTLGEIEEVILSQDLQEIHYVILATGGFLGFGEKPVPVPLNTIEFNKEKKRLESDLTEQAVKSLPEFSAEDVSEKRWKLSSLSGQKIYNRKDKSIGDLDAVIISLKHGKLSFAVINGDTSFDKLKGKTIIVPWSAVAVSNTGSLSVDADQEQIEAVAFEKDKVPFLGDLRFGEHIYGRFKKDPYWPSYETDKAWYGGWYYGYWPYSTPGVYYY